MVIILPFLCPRRSSCKSLIRPWTVEDARAGFSTRFDGLLLIDGSPQLRLRRRYKAPCNKFATKTKNANKELQHIKVNGKKNKTTNHKFTRKRTAPIGLREIIIREIIITATRTAMGVNHDNNNKNVNNNNLTGDNNHTGDNNNNNKLTGDGSRRIDPGSGVAGIGGSQTFPASFELGADFRQLLFLHSQFVLRGKMTFYCDNKRTKGQLHILSCTTMIDKHRYE